MNLEEKSMSEFNMETFRRPIIARISVAINLFFFMFVFYLSPVGKVVAQEVTTPVEKITLTGSPEQKMNQGLLKVQEIAAKKLDKIKQRLIDEGSFWESALELIGLGQLTLEDVNELQQLVILIQEQHEIAIASFNDTEAKLSAKNLPEVILQRHRDAVTKYQASYNDMQQKIQAVLQANSLQEQEAASSNLDALMNKQKLKKSHQKTDPNNLPFGSPDPSKTRKPAKTAEELSSLTGISNEPPQIMLAANMITPEMLGQPGGPVAADLAETPDIKFTAAIKAKALELQEDPVKIYNWVRNNIEFIPSYGSIQGADYTLQHGKGNAFDTASLLIALYRSANIPARYAYGTVEIPVEKVMNWVGGVDVPEAAQQLLGQGGIPNVAIVKGGKITHIRMETVWAEVWVDYFPSRAAKHITGDQWIPIDASFKQYEFIKGRDLADNVPFDVEGFVSDVNISAVVNESEGTVYGVDAQKIKLALTTYKQQVDNYINAQNPNASVGELLGTYKVILKEFQQLVSGLPYKLVTRTNNYSELPNNLRHKFRYTLGTELYGSEGNRLITFEKSLPELAGNKLSLSFRPSSQADIDLIRSYMPKADPVSGEIDVSSLSKTLPGYLISLIAEFSQNESIVTSAASGTMGSELYETLALWSPIQGWQQAVNHPIAGEFRAIGLNLQGASSAEGESLKTNVESTENVFLNGNEAEISSLSKHQVNGNILHTAIFSYLAVSEVQDKVQASIADVINYRLPSYGVFSTGLQTSYWFGIPRDVSFSGLVMDVDHLSTQSVSKDSDKQKQTDYIKLTGMTASIMENLIPEHLFSTETNPVEGISAVKALAIASAEGQKTWTITKENLNKALLAINLSSDIENEISNAVMSGKVVTAHEKPVNYAGGTNVGYLLIDPESGAGAYKIASGANGGFLDFGSIIDFISSLLGEFSSEVSKYFGKMIGRMKQAFDFSETAGECGLAFSLIKFFSVLAFTVGMVFLFMPYFYLLGLFAASLLVSILRILIVEIIISSYFASKFTCKK